MGSGWVFVYCGFFEVRWWNESRLIGENDEIFVIIWIDFLFRGQSNLALHGWRDTTLVLNGIKMIQKIQINSNFKNFFKIVQK